jgi:hypothetical protein
MIVSNRFSISKTVDSVKATWTTRTSVVSYPVDDRLPLQTLSPVTMKHTLAGISNMMIASIASPFLVFRGLFGAKWEILRPMTMKYGGPLSRCNSRLWEIHRGGR